MTGEVKLLTNVTDSLSQRVEFQVSAAMVKRFADLSGDFSSLHMNREFGRRSSYRDNVVHGMLPVAFIFALPARCRDGYRCSLQKVSARFLKPVFVNDNLLLEAKATGADDKQNRLELEYVLSNVESGSVLTTGYFALSYTRTTTSSAGQKRQSPSPKANICMVTDSLVEQELRFQEIHKGDEEHFGFHLLEEHAGRLYQILDEGLSSTHQLDLSEWMINCNPANLLTSCLFSTFVGMCIPGKHATFMDFSATFDQPIQWGKNHIFSGKVRYISSSTDTVVESISIYSVEDEPTIYASGKITAKVNKLPIEMPSIERLKNNDLDLQLRDKVVLITGASRGIGETTAKLFSLHGARVALNYLQGKNDADRIVDEISSNSGRAMAVQADVSDRGQVKRMVESICAEYGTIHILVNNAVNNTYPVGFLELTWDELQKDVEVIIKGAFNCCQEVLPLMMKNQEGKIINISTIFTDAPPPGQAKYVIAKSGLVGLTRSLAVEFASHNIQVNMVAPSIVETDLSKHVSKMFLEKMKFDTPMGRNATPVDVAQAVIYLASSLASFTTGQKFMVTGGNLPFL